MDLPYRGAGTVRQVFGTSPPKVGWLRRAAVVVQDAAETFATRNRRSRIGVLVGHHRDRRDQPIVQPLVIAFEVVVLDELRDREAKVALTEGNELAQALGLDREYKAFRKCVQIWAAGRELEARDARSAQNRAERVGEQRSRS